MKPRGPLMIEHRLIEKMIELIRGEIAHIEQTHEIKPDFIDIAVDFIRMYADRTHHGKEEDILFRALEEKSMSDEDHRIMNELINEHVFARGIVKQLVKAKQRYLDGEDTTGEILAKLSELVEFYPPHIKKEDDVFFPHSERYFVKDELKEMLEKFEEFDSRMIHEKYQSVVEQAKERYTR